MGIPACSINSLIGESTQKKQPGFRKNLFSGLASPLLRDKFGADSLFLRLFFGYPSLIRERSLNE
ncbi:hypothetical protein DDZ16_12965 [Marinilabilia rubra]|uniref:Uncharacterized protein n=1 Tax=Marinilabilia rubra TaxID=2162893 RepID=A0A2U2B776_9BACT|nr:hypothetical protein DDZ16_12965 [Marinilabilia rubra]